MEIAVNQEVLLLAVGILTAWLLALSFFLAKTVRHYRKLGAGLKEGDLKKVLEEILKDLRTEREIREKLEKGLKSLEKETGYHFQKIGLLRYNPFSDTGGDQSFVLAILDGKDSGLVISNLHGREQTRIYAKPVKEGKASGYELSKEEKEVIKKAKKIK